MKFVNPQQLIRFLSRFSLFVRKKNTFLGWKVLLVVFGLNTFLFLSQNITGMQTNSDCAEVSLSDESRKELQNKIIYSENGITVTAENAVLTANNFDKKVFLTIGLPSSERKSQNYLTRTLDSLLYNVSAAEDFKTKIVILLADMQSSVRKQRFHQLLSRYSNNLGFIGKLYRSETLENQARFIQLFYSEMPVDLLMNTYRKILGHNLMDTTYFRNLFVHIGYESTALS
ncbi:uncharacterized protein LOC124446286 isoform X2 [Xenia sp. Carnegie-2017]|uniref:uncharacterized protein LOC124446286 isoform X2 n=1 Tax=Xenia sp. Carnegie-2017 TaxID=2897299 RepID=UPI001F03B171|nr:uncharacterized protein LOC124446286 isoform X2 [Xenia sp. Carnegie-2017]